MAWNVSVLVSMVAIILLMQTRVGETTDDLALAFCGAVCWNEGALAEQCEITRECNSNALSRERRNRCSNRCYRASARCWGFCRRNFDQIFQQCLPQCSSLESSYQSCLTECFIDRALTIKYGTQTEQRGANPFPPPPPGVNLQPPPGEDHPPPTV